MNSNLMADMIGEVLSKIHPRVYRGKAPKERTFPYVVYRFESVTNSYPSTDYYLNVDIYEDPKASIRDVENIGDAVVQSLDQMVLRSTGLNLQIDLETRQSMDAQALIDAYLVNIRFTVRSYTF